jgi:hypothetical protein
MAERALQKGESGPGFQIWFWEGLTAGDTGEPIEINQLSGLASSVEMIGTFGAAVHLKGAIEGTSFHSIETPTGAAVSRSSAGITEIASTARLMRPEAASGVSDVDVYLLVRGTK